MSERQLKLKNLVTDIESSFNVEVLTMVVKSSTPTGHVKWILFLFFISVALSFNFALLFENLWMSKTQELFLFAIELAASAGFAFLLAKIDFFQRFLTSDQDEVRMVEMRAENEFFKNNFYQTKNRNGILFFISKMEKRVQIVADEKLSKILSSEDKQLLITEMVGHLKTHQPLEDVLISTLELFKLKLKEHSQAHRQLLRNPGAENLNVFANDLIKKD